jgi:WD40 repeat protein
MTSFSGNLKTILIDMLSVHEYIQLKSKIKTLDIHPNLPWIVFSDLENNIMVFDIIDKKPLRAFSMQQFLMEQVNIKDLKFFNTNDKHYVNNYDLNEIKKIKGIPFQLRSNLIIVTLEKLICFYSCVTQTFIKTITSAELEQKLPVKCEVFNYMYMVIQTSDGSLIIWNLLDWALVKIINKANVNKPVGNFIVISTRSEERYIVVSNTNGNLFLVDLSKKEVAIQKLDEKVNN